METESPNLKSKIQNFPQTPGVYQFLDKDGGVIYVGKAKNLRARVRQYFRGGDGRPQIPFLMHEAADVGYTVVNNELESLYLENTVIKQYRPKYNILLRDDKNYAFIKIDYSTEIPQIGYSRKIADRSEYNELYPNAPKREASDNSDVIRRFGSAKYFGPYTAAYKIRNTLDLVRKIFPYCSAQKVGSRPCFHYYLHRCPGVCIGKISLAEYKLQLDKICEFLNGDVSRILKSIHTEMAAAAADRKFEAAARLRDQLRALELLREKQTVILPKKVDWDIVSLAASDGYVCVNLFKIREGKMFDKENFVYGDTNTRIQTNDTNITQRFLEQYYAETNNAPGEIFLQQAAADESIVSKLLADRFGRKIKISLPKKGKQKNLAKLGETNAAEFLRNWISDRAGNLDKINAALDGLKDILHLSTRPERIECYDISNIQGTNAVGSMVVFKKGLPAKSEYRKFKIRRLNTPDDFAMMKEVLGRRFLHSVIARNSELGNEPAERRSNPVDGKRLPRPSDALGARNGTILWPLPDLIVIDGGKGQLSAAAGVLTTYNLQPTTPIIGLAKRIEEIFVPGKSEPIILSHSDPALQMLQRLRDEAHRFGITFHRNLRSKQAVKSALDDIPGIGPKTKKLLKQKFGTVAQIKKTGGEELANTVGKKLAEKIRSGLP